MADDEKGARPYVCRFTLYMGPSVSLGSLLTEPSHSLIKQSFQSREREEPLNGDGFGVAWFVPEVTREPAVFRSISPAWSNRNLQSLARVTRSGCILAHVRAATQGIPVTETNCHPFTQGELAFAHNGDLGGFREYRRALIERLSDAAFEGIDGTTDSEHLFALTRDRLEGGKAAAHPATQLAEALRAAFSEVIALARKHAEGEENHLNVALTDGRSAVVSRFTTGDPAGADSLYLSSGRRYTCAKGVCRMLDPEGHEETVIVSSERLSEDPSWQEVPANHFVLVHADRRVEVVPCGV